MKTNVEMKWSWLILRYYIPSQRLLKEIASATNNLIAEFYILLTVHPGMILVNNQIDEQFSCMFTPILYMFLAAMRPSSEELLYQCETWFMSLCVDDRLVCIPDGRTDTIILLMMGTWLLETCRE